MAMYNILNLAHGLCLSGQPNGGTFALFYAPKGQTYNLWTFSPTPDGYWKVMNQYAPAQALVGPVDVNAGGGGYCYVQEPGTGQHGDWKIDGFAAGPVLGVPFQLMNRKHSEYAAVGPDAVGGSTGVNTYFQKPAKRLNSWWVLVLKVDKLG